MRRIFGQFAYGPGPRNGCWWDETYQIEQRTALSGGLDVDVAVIGAGFTGLSAAHHLAENGASVAVLEANAVGWGASGRNGGFCCLGGGKITDNALDARYGKDARLAFRTTEKAAVRHVEDFLSRTGADVDRHSDGETQLAHRPRDMDTLRDDVSRIRENYGVEAEITEASDLVSRGMSGGPFFGALTLPVGFGLNPRKYVAALATAAEQAGVAIFERSAVMRLERDGRKWRLVCASGEIRAGRVIVATNGYSSEDVPAWLAGRYMPAQSTVMVTRPLSDAELSCQGWTSAQMCYDTRNLLHYFRLMPDRRMLFGMRGAVLTGPGAEARARAATRRHFARMFPEWDRVEISHMWSGLVALARNRLPYVGEVPEHPGLSLAMCYHGNGVAMGSYAGRLVAGMCLTGTSGDCPEVMRRPLTRFPFGRWRRVAMPALYAGFMVRDRVSLPRRAGR